LDLEIMKISNLSELRSGDKFHGITKSLDWQT
jgi:hypothetical protein